MLSANIAKLLRQSPFDSLEDARAFLKFMTFYKDSKKTAWDEERRELAEELLEEFRESGHGKS